MGVDDKIQTYIRHKQNHFAWWRWLQTAKTMYPCWSDFTSAKKPLSKCHFQGLRYPIPPVLICHYDDGQQCKEVKREAICCKPEWHLWFLAL